MPRSAFFSKDEVVAAALRLVQRDGFSSLTARALSKELGCSLSPLFTLFKDMDEIVASVRVAGEAYFDEYMKDVDQFFPAFKEFGIRMIRFEREEPNLAWMLFSSPGGNPKKPEMMAKRLLMAVDHGYGLSEEQAELLFRQMWAVSTGAVSLFRQSPQEFTEELISSIMSCNFAAMMGLIKSGRPVEDIVPKHK